MPFSSLQEGEKESKVRHTQGNKSLTEIKGWFNSHILKENLEN